MVDQRLRAELAAVAERVRPAPDPLGRLYARRRRNRRRATAFGGAALAVVVAVTMLTFAPVDGIDREIALRQEWIGRLVDSPVRGDLSGDAAFVDKLTQYVGEAQAAGRIEIPPHLDSVKVLFVADAGPVRVALAAFSETPGGLPAESQPSAVWMLASAGATAETLAGTLNRDADPKNYQATGVDPLMLAELDVHIPGTAGTVSIGLAPGGCEFATAALPTATDWRPESTGSYVVRAPAEHRPEWWRVTCNGVVRAEGPAPFTGAPGNAGQFKVTDARYAETIANTRGTVDPSRVREQLLSAATRWGYLVSDMPVMLWSGDNPGPGDLAGQVTVVAGPLVGGGWAFEITVHYEPARPDGTGATNFGFYTNVNADLAAPATLVPILISDGSTGQVLVIAPVGAATVRAVRAGVELTRAQVRDDAAVLRIPADATIVVEALDAGGAVLARGGFLPQTDSIRGIDAWHEN